MNRDPRLEKGRDWRHNPRPGKPWPKYARESGGRIAR